ncbi:MAG: dUTP diphosphatase [Holosporales bacterium]|jgi:dUTP pyrophosphatase|nr:dUTP diphosphatase [Holosporales bacterium]
MKINFQKLNVRAIVPTYGTEHSAGIDMAACIDEDIIIAPSQIVIIGTGLAMEIPNGYFGMLCPRSGLAAKFGITLLNSPGVIDSDYRGEIRAVMINHSNSSFRVSHGMRIAQLIISPFRTATLEEVEGLEVSGRGSNGFGSTGI